MNERAQSLLQSLLLNVDLLNSEVKRLQHSGNLVLTPECMMLLRQLQESYVRGLKEIERLTLAP